jgi:hypothetical protein
MRDEQLEGLLRDALVGEAASLDLEVTPVDVRRRLTHRQRQRQASYLATAAVLALLVAGLSGPVVSTVASFLESLRPPAGQAADIAWLDAPADALVITRVWPDGRREEQARYAGVLEPIRAATAMPGQAQLPWATVARPGPSGRLSLSFLDWGSTILLAPPGHETPPWFVWTTEEASSATQSVRWEGWSPDGRFLAVGASSGTVHVFDPATRTEETFALPAGVRPWRDPSAWMSDYDLVWTTDGRIVATRTTGSGTSELGALDLAGDQPSFTAGTPSGVSLVTGKEIGPATDGSEPVGWADGSASVAGTASLGDGVTQGWYVAPSGQKVTGVVRSGDARGLVIVVADPTGSGVTLVVADKPGDTHEGPHLDNLDASNAPIRAVAPDGQSVVAGSVHQVIVDLVHGDRQRLPAGSIFVRWVPSPTSPLVAGSTACRTPTAEAVSTVALAPGGADAPALVGQRPLAVPAGDNEPWPVGALDARPAVEVPAAGSLVLALPADTCATAWAIEAVRLDADGAIADPAIVLGETDPGDPPRSGLLGFESPPAGDWVVRARLRFAGSDEETTLLYRVTTTDPTSTPVPTTATRPPDASGTPIGPSAQPPAPTMTPLPTHAAFDLPATAAITVHEVAAIGADGSPTLDVAIDLIAENGGRRTITILNAPYTRGRAAGGPWRRTGDPAWSEEGYLAIPVVSDVDGSPALLVFDATFALASAEPLVIPGVDGTFAWGPGARLVIPGTDSGEVVVVPSGATIDVTLPADAGRDARIVGWSTDGRLLVASVGGLRTGTVSLDGVYSPGPAARYDPFGIAARADDRPALVVEPEGRHLVTSESGGVRRTWEVGDAETIDAAWWAADGDGILMLVTGTGTPSVPTWDQSGSPVFLQVRHVDNSGALIGVQDVFYPEGTPMEGQRLLGVAPGDAVVAIEIRGPWGRRLQPVNPESGVLVTPLASQPGEPPYLFAGWASVPGKP